MKPCFSYRKRRDLMLKNFSASKCVDVLSDTMRHCGTFLHYKRGRPCEVKKEKLVAFILWSRLTGDKFEEMEQNSELFLNRHYDHSNLHYHYTRLPATVLYTLTSILERKIKSMINEILLHIADSTALSTSVREERLVQGTRNKVKLTTKFHTLLGYDPTFQLLVVEGMLASDKHISDSKGTEQSISQEKLKGYLLGDSAFETYDLINLAKEKGLTPLFKPQKKTVRKKLSYKAQLRKVWNGNHSRLYKDIRGSGEALYGAATRTGIIFTHCKRTDNQHKDSLIIGLRQNLFTYLRLKSVFQRIIRKTPIQQLIT